MRWVPTTWVFVELDGAASQYVGRVAAANFLPYDLDEVGSFVEAGQIEVTPDGAWAVAAGRFSEEVIVVDVGRRELASQAPVPGKPNGVAIRPDALQAALGTQLGVTFVALEGGQATVTASVPLAFGAGRKLAYSPDGAHLYAAAGSDVFVFDTETHAVVTETEVAGYTYQLVLSGDGSRLIVADTDVELGISPLTRLTTYTADGASLEVEGTFTTEYGLWDLAATGPGRGALFTQPVPDRIGVLG